MAWLFDEIDDNVSVADNALLTLPAATGWTVAGRFKLTDNTGSGYQYLISFGYAATSTFYVAIAEATEGTGNANKLQVSARDAEGDKFEPAYAGAPGADTNWHSLIVTRSGNTMTVYLDGVSIGSATVANVGDINAAAPWLFGARADLNADRFYGGQLAEWAKWPRPLTDAERAAYDLGCSPDMIPTADWVSPFRAAGNDIKPASLTATVTGGSAAAHPAIRMPGAARRLRAA